MTFLTILGVIEILCSFRLVLEGKTGKEIGRPKMGNREKHEKYPNKLGKPYVKYEETYGEMGENM